MKQQSLSRKTKKYLLSALILVVIIPLVAVLPILTILIYNLRFNLRFSTDPLRSFHLEQYEGLVQETCSFTSNQGQKLTGYKYHTETSSETSGPRGVLVMAHGFSGGGHNLYMDVAAYFAAHDYLVFAYDATGNDASEGKGVGGFPQGVIDLDHALSYVKEQPEYQNLPIVLFGHSWGAYSVGNVLNYHPDVKAAVMVAGFNQSADLIEYYAWDYAGNAKGLLMPYVKLYEYIKFGKYSRSSAVSGFENTDADIMILHSLDDKTVPAHTGYEIFYEKFQDDPRFTFVLSEDRGHNNVYYTKDSNKYYRTLDQDVMAEMLEFYNR